LKPSPNPRKQSPRQKAMLRTAEGTLTLCWVYVADPIEPEPQKDPH
jgi:hypothetical protein